MPDSNRPYSSLVLITIRVTRQERAQLRDAAAKAGLSLQQLAYNRIFDHEEDEEIPDLPDDTRIG